MRIAFTGTGNTGKSTLVDNFRAVWPVYHTPEKTYRDFLIEEKLAHSKISTPDTQQRILDFMLDTITSNKHENVVYDRCPLDNLAYTLWCFDHDIEGFDKPFVDNTIKMVRESMRMLDIIFLLKYDPKIPIDDDGTREANVEYIREVDDIFEALYQQYLQAPEADIFYPVGDSPCIIQLPTNPQARIDTVADYVGTDGSIVEDSRSVLDSENLNDIEKLLAQQASAVDAENAEKELMEKFGISTEKGRGVTAGGIIKP